MGISDNQFDDIIQNTLENEGGYVHNFDDPGGETNFGISKRSYPNLDIKNLTEEEAISIYKRDFWDDQSYKDINNAAIAAKAFDMAVNMGPFQANKLLQKAVGAISVDGVIGPLSLSAINGYDPDQLMHNFRDQLTSFYQSLVARDPSKKQFLDGWLRRVNQ